MTSLVPVRVTVLHTPACHFCDDARAALAELAHQYSIQVELVEAASPAGQALLGAHRTGMFPVVLVDGAFFSAGRLPCRKLRGYWPGAPWLQRKWADHGPALVGVGAGGLLPSPVGSCCSPPAASFLVPSYLAVAGRTRRWRLLPLSFVFAAGLALVLVPITLGMSLLAATISKFHAPLYNAGGALMLALAAFALSGRMWSMPRLLRMSITRSQHDEQDFRAPQGLTWRGQSV
jgi:glutaredoxin